MKSVILIMLVACKRTPPTWHGVPAKPITCEFGLGSKAVTCVAGARLYKCVESWSDNDVWCAAYSEYPAEASP